MKTGILLLIVPVQLMSLFFEEASIIFDEEAFRFSSKFLQEIIKIASIKSTVSS